MRFLPAAVPLLLYCSLAHGTGNGFSFTSELPIAAIDRLDLLPVMSCKEVEGGLKAALQPALQIISAETDMPAGIPGACTVKGVIRGRIEFVVNLPAVWNGRLYVHGNGGYAGESIHGDFGLAQRTRAVRHGFAAAFTNLGHDAEKQPGATFALGDREAEVDYSYRALHETTLAAKEILGAYFGKTPQRSYFDGCSTGGGQGLKAALQYPEDFDGIAAGAPVFDWIGLQIYGWNNQLAIRDTPFNAEKVQLLGRIILDKFDVVDGLKDGVIDDPRVIDFVPARDLPHGTGGFNNAELAALTRLYQGTQINGVDYPGVPPGGEMPGLTYQSGSDEPAPIQSAWASRIYADASGYLQQRGNVETWLRYLAFESDNTGMTLEELDPAHDIPRMQYMAELLGVVSTDLGAFRDRGGKLLMYHGWGDIGVNPVLTMNYYERVLAARGIADTREFFRLFMVPGMFHCRGGVNVDRFDAMAPLIRWVESGVAPDSIEAQRVENGRVTRTRPLCPYPEVARMTADGDPNRAESFRCVEVSR